MEKIDLLLKTIGYNFKNKKLLITALTHSSYANEHSTNKMKDNERLEFLGDSVLDLITTEYIMQEFSNFNEGQLSKIKSQVISEKSFSDIARKIKLGDYIYLSNGENVSGGRNRNSTLCDAFEALIGAIYLDSDYITVKNIAIKYLKQKIHNLQDFGDLFDYKTELQELIQSKNKTVPVYKLLESSGPDHNKEFKIAVVINDEIKGIGIAKSKKQAEKNAAKYALEKLKGI